MILLGTGKPASDQMAGLQTKLRCAEAGGDTSEVYHDLCELSNGILPAPVTDLIAQAQRLIRRNEGGAALAAFSLARCVAQGDEIGTYRAAHTLARYMTQVDKHRAVERSLRELAGRKVGAHG